MQRKSLSRLCIVSLAGLAALALAIVFVPGAGAQRGGLRANIYLTQARVPTKTTERGLIAFARGRQARVLRETTDTPLPQRKWLAEMVTSFNRPPGDLEFHVLFYDIHDGPRRFVEDMSTFVNDRSQKTFVQRVRLERPRFRPNRNMELVVTVRRMEVGRQRFGLVGEEPRRSGQVDFSDEDTHQRD